MYKKPFETLTLVKTRLNKTWVNVWHKEYEPRYKHPNLNC